MISNSLLQSACDSLHYAGDLEATYIPERIRWSFFFFPVDSDKWCVSVELRNPTLYKIVRAINYYIDKKINEDKT